MISAQFDPSEASRFSLWVGPTERMTLQNAGTRRKILILSAERRLFPNENTPAIPVVDLGPLVDRHNTLRPRTPILQSHCDPVARLLAGIATGGERRANAIAGRAAAGLWKTRAVCNCDRMSSK